MIGLWGLLSGVYSIIIKKGFDVNMKKALIKLVLLAGILSTGFSLKDKQPGSDGSVNSLGVNIRFSTFLS